MRLHQRLHETKKRSNKKPDPLDFLAPPAGPELARGARKSKARSVHDRAFFVLSKCHIGFTSSIMMQAINVTSATHLISSGVDESIMIKSLGHPIYKKTSRCSQSCP
jgi:hypothetical protein